MNQPTKAVTQPARNRSEIVAGLLEDRRESLMEMIPKQVDSERFLRIAISCIAKNPDLMECTSTSLVSSVMEAAQCGLEIGVFNQCWLIPFNNKQPNGSWAKEAKLMLGYGGLVTVAKNSGDLASVQTNEVREEDEFWADEEGFHHKFDPLGTDRGELRGYYTRCRLTNGEVQWTAMTMEQIEKVRQACKSKNSPGWRNHHGEMCKKTVLKRSLKTVKLSTQAMEVLTRDDEQHGIVTEQVKDTSKLGNAGLLAMIDDEPAEEPNPPVELEVDPVTGEVLPEEFQVRTQ